MQAFKAEYTAELVRVNKRMSEVRKKRLKVSKIEAQLEHLRQMTFLIIERLKCLFVCRETLAAIEGIRGEGRERMQELLTAAMANSGANEA